MATGVDTDTLKLAPGELYRAVDPSELAFETTAELEALPGILGQPRAEEALTFGVEIDAEGYNLFALGPQGTGRHSMIRRFLAERAAERPTPADWCYVHNFDDEQSPRPLELPPGRGATLRQDMEQLVEDLGSALVTAFEGEDYQARRKAIDEEIREASDEAFQELGKKARERGLAIVRTPMGLVFAPAPQGEVLSKEEFEKLPEEEREKLEAEVERLEADLERIFRRTPRWQRERREKIRELHRELTDRVVGPVIDELKRKYEELGEVVAHLDAVHADVIRNARSFLGRDGEGEPAPDGGEEGPVALAPSSPTSLRRYRVNVLVDNREAKAAPVVFEDNPTFSNLVGRVEHIARMGTLTTDFTLIKPGALHRANGGYLVVDALDLLRQPFAWEGLKRTLKRGTIKIESPGESLGLISTVSLRPEPVPLDLKVVLVGERTLYYMLGFYDEDFSQLFKVAVDFEESLDRTTEVRTDYVRLLAKLVDEQELRAFDRTAVARVLEQSSRMAEDAEKLSLRSAKLLDLVREADYWAGKAGRDVVGAADVQRAIDAQIRRSDRVRERLQESIRRDLLMIDTEGAAVGQINALGVLRLDELDIGHPIRVTARVRLGEGEVVDIEREVELAGPIHSKGVMILSGFLGQRYAREEPLSLAATLVFEQSYGGVEGDSASLAELAALLSAISGLPISQSLALTGSVNQHGRTQPIGGVNAKVEGFFDVCRDRGLTGEQGVLIPRANVQHLMLRRDLVEAVEAGRFHLWAVESVDEAMELLTGTAAGTPDETGRYPEGSVNGAVAAGLAGLARRRRAFSAGPGGKGAGGGEGNG